MLSKKTQNKQYMVLALLAMMIAPTQIFAADLPAILVVYKDIISNIVAKVIVGVVILIMLVYSGYEAKENGNARPFKWALFGSTIMGGAVYFGNSIIDFMASQLSGLTGTGAVVVGS